MKKILSLLLISSSIFSMELDVIRDKQAFDMVQLQHKSHKMNDLAKVYIAKESVFVPNKLGELKLSHGKKGFCIHKDGEKHLIKRYNVDQMVRNMTKEELKSFLAVGYLCLNQMSNDEYSLKANARINGGGALGASFGAFLGKAAVSLVGHGTILLIGALTGPAAPATVIVLEGCFGPIIETTSMAGAIAGGIALGVATGPVWSIGMNNYSMHV